MVSTPSIGEEAVLFPPKPLFMVDRSWQRRGRKSSPSKVPEKSSRVPEVTITVLNGFKTSQKGITRPANANVNSTPKPLQAANVQFLNYQPPTTGRRGGRNKTKRPLKEDKNDGGGPSKSQRNSALVPDGGRFAEAESEHPSLFTRSIPKSTSPVYTLIDPEVSTFEKFLVYYPTRLADAVFPMAQYLNFEYNTLQKIWLPAAVMDEVLLHTILFACALHLHHVSEYHEFKDASLLMKVILDKLNRRLRTKILSDATIGAVSCLAMCENTLGKHEKFAMHMSGMAEMVRVRGGMTAIRRELQMKIYRADIAGAVDSLCSPWLSPPVRTSKSLYESLNLERMHRSPLEVMLESSGVSQQPTNLLVQLSHMSSAIEHAMNSRTVLDPLTFDEEVLCVQSDLLMSVTAGGARLDKACELGALIYLQTLTRSAPFIKSSSEALSRELQVSLLHINVAEISCPLMFWLLVMGGLVSFATSERDWFRSQLRNCQVSWKGMITWECMKVQLMSVMWIDRIHDNFGRELWEDVVAPAEI